MQKNKLHIVSFDIPLPADYGGAVDVFYKIKALSEAGVEIYLHCFEYGRERQPELERWCKEVWYYPRNTGLKGISFKLPYIVNSRRDKMLLQRLADIDAPLLFEGVHTTYYLNHPQIKERFKAVRTHNIEHIYYHELYKKEAILSKRLYYEAEAILLKSYESKLSNASAFFSLSKTDADFFAMKYPRAETQFIAPFHPFEKVDSLSGKGDYCLYHGNLGHTENIEAAFFLLREVASHISMPLVIAGRNPAQKIVEVCRSISGCTLVANPDYKQMEDLIANAQIHLLPTFQPTGMKLKLLYALFNGRHVVVNRQMLHGTDLENACTIANDANGFINAINNLSDVGFTQQDIEARNRLLQRDYSNKTGAQKIIRGLRY